MRTYTIPESFDSCNHQRTQGLIVNDTHPTINGYYKGAVINITEHKYTSFDTGHFQNLESAVHNLDEDFQNL